MTKQSTLPKGAPVAPFTDPNWTAKGERRASVALDRLETLWFNTGTLCNIECLNCYIESSPSNDRLVYITQDEVARYLDEIAAHDLGTREIGLTGGEPFMNPDIIEILRLSLGRGFDTLVLTNAMSPMMRARMRPELAHVIAAYGDKLTFRISLDHHRAEEHDRLRGAGAFEKTLVGMRWLSGQGARLAIAGRTIWGETDAEARAGFAALFAHEGFAIDAADHGACVLFPEMDAAKPTPEITEACWGILGKSPAAVMCNSSRMVIKRKGAASPSVAACTLLPYDTAFDLGETLAEAARPVALNHPHCSKFCVLGGASCSA